MIFNSNTTALGASTIPMAEGYDCSYGVSLALVESARNDFAMFQALVQADYKEMSICKESTGVVMEGEISALHEAVGGGIFKKIAELFKKLVAKIKAIIHNFVAKIRGLYMKDKDLVKRYWKTVTDKKDRLDKLEIKWRNKTDKYDSVTKFDAEITFDENVKYSDDEWERVSTYLSNDVKAESLSEYHKEALKTAFEEEKVVKLGEVGGINEIMDYLNKYETVIKSFETNSKKITDKLAAKVKEYETKASKASNTASADTTNKEKADEYESANHTYEMAKAYQSAQLAIIDIAMKANTIMYKQNKAAFMKAVVANKDKLKESAEYLNAVAEAEEQKVDDVITTAMSDEEISDLSAATVDVKDADVKDDPDALTYAPDCYTQNADMSDEDVDGTVDTCVGDGKVEESAYFGKLFY